MKTKATKIDANTWQYAGFTINRCTHSRTFLATRPDGTKTYVRDTLREVVTDIDCWNWKQCDIKDRAERATREACAAWQQVACPDAHTCRYGVDK